MKDKVFIFGQGTEPSCYKQALHTSRSGTLGGASITIQYSQCDPMVGGSTLSKAAINFDEGQVERCV